jgi:hypothetical protein
MAENAVSEIVVRGQHVRTETTELPVETLRFWSDNPRVKAAMAEDVDAASLTQDEIDERLWQFDYVHVLLSDIEQHGGLIDEVVVQGNTVLEGNSRLCAYRHLLKRARDRNDLVGVETWSKIRCRVVPTELKPEIVLALLGIWHLKGKHQWTPYEKAFYMKRMASDFHWSEKKVADSVDMTAKSVQNNIRAYDLMTENKCKDYEKFSHFYELVKNKKLDILKSEVPDLVEKTVEAIIQDRFDRGEQIRDLHKVLRDKVARRQFLQEAYSFSDAFETAKEHHPENADSFFNHMKKSIDDLHNCTTERVEEIKRDTQKRSLLKNLRSEANRVWNQVETN